jgi:hypothetical protein
MRACRYVVSDIFVLEGVIGVAIEVRIFRHDVEHLDLKPA